MAALCAGRIVIVTGAGRGLTRLRAASREGARVVVNDLGTTLAGSGRDSATAQAVVEEIRSAGGEAVANGDDVSDWEGAERMVATALEHFGGLDVVVNNACVVRDRMFVSATVEEWDATMQVHLRGHFCVARHAVDYWRACAKQGKSVDARIINTLARVSTAHCAKRARRGKGGIATPHTCAGSGAAALRHYRKHARPPPRVRA
jgi:NAD(P)-dependent dehydrogenase (short-subunit alcohol dehydrogenase family)